MFFKTIATYIFFVSIGTALFAQKLKKGDKIIITDLQAHVNYLADDKLEGRRLGSEGERKAMEYIAIQFAKAGLTPQGDKGGWYQAFNVYEGKETTKNNFLFINGEEIKLKDYFPFIGSPDKLVEGVPSIALQETGLPWFLNLTEELENNKNNKAFNVKKYIFEQAKNAATKKATALIVYNNGDKEDGLIFNAKEKLEKLDIPILYIKNEISKKYFTDEAAAVDIKLKVVFTDKKRTGHNVVGYINNNAGATIVMGAHFDHLGYGEDNNSLYKGMEKMIHNGADDNASGTAALIELAKLLKTSKFKNNNYLFIAFSGQEVGLCGSKYFTEHPTLDFSTLNYMINIDMIGRLNDTTKALHVGGYGTSPLWGKILSAINTEKKFTNKYDSSGISHGDNTSFYLKNIPVLSFFTDTHNDYHRPTDDREKINYTGELFIIKYIFKIVEQFNNKGKIPFTKTNETKIVSSINNVLSTGITPDLTFVNNGVRALFISDGMPAYEAGLEAGDIIIQLGDAIISSIDNYQNALNNFKIGDKVPVKVKRNNETIETEIQL